MDEMRVKLTTRFMRNVVSKLITRSIYKKYGCKIDIQLNELDFWSIDGNTTIKVNVEAKLKSDEFNKIIKLAENDLDV